LEQINNNARFAIATTLVDMPKWLNDKNKANRKRRRRRF